MAPVTWECSCGRRVPLSVDACRCGAARPDEDAFTMTASPADEPVTADEESPGLPRWVTQLGGLLLVVGIYFGSRSCNRWQTSREVKATAVEGLSEAGVEEAGKVLDRHHLPCFDETYKTGWGRRQASKFDEEKYVACIIRRLEKERFASVRPVSARPRGPAATRLPTPTPPPRTLPPPPDVGHGLITIAYFDLKAFKRQPNVQLVFTFKAAGLAEAIQQELSCSLDVQCGGQPLLGDQLPAITNCPLQAEGILGTGTVVMSWANATPAQGDCTLRLALVRGSQRVSTELVVALKEMPGS